jgi:hypothetical protein
MGRIALLFAAVLSAPSAAQQPQAPTVPHDSVRGAIRAIDTTARTIEVTAGVGYALRVVRMQVPASVPITDPKAGQSLGLGGLRLGDVIRAQFGGYPAKFVAYTIERIGRMETGVGRTP